MHTIAEFFVSFLALLPSLLGRLIAAWLATFILLVYGFHWLKPRVRPRLLRIDDRVRAWAKGLRFVGEGDGRRELLARTWFFRFWTNFASAPSLCLFSLGVPLCLYWFFVWTLETRYLFALQDGEPQDFTHGTGVPTFPTVPPALHATMAHDSFAHAKLWLLPGLCYSGAMLLSYVLKRIFKRLRPPIEKGAFGHKLLRDPSFPSGHSLTSFCFWMMMAVTVALSGVALPFAIAFAVIAVSIVALTGLSRVYMGVHFPSDVLGGYTIGLVWCLISFIALRGVL